MKNTEYTGIIYEAFWNKEITNKLYVGQTKQKLNIRISEHKSRALKYNDNYKFYNAIRKYGMPEFRIIDTYITDNLETLNDALDTLETYYITDRDSYNNGYNSTPCGGTSRGAKWNEESKLKISLARKGRISPMKGLTHSEKSKLKMSLNKKGKHYSINTEFTSERMKGNNFALKEIPTVAQDENGVYQLVYPHQFKNYKLSPWHTACRQLHIRNYRKILNHLDKGL